MMLEFKNATGTVWCRAAVIVKCHSKIVYSCIFMITQINIRRFDYALLLLNKIIHSFSFIIMQL